MELGLKTRIGFRPMKPNFKTIDYRGGVVSFEIPDDWKEEYKPKGGGTFYEDRPESGTLRLHVLGFSSTTGRSSEDTLRRLDAKEPFEKLKCGLHMKRYVKKAEEDGEVLSLYRWEIRIPVPPVDWRMACFTYTIVAGQEADPVIREELDLVDEIIHAARFSTASGITGDYYPESEQP